MAGLCSSFRVALLLVSACGLVAACGGAGTGGSGTSDVGAEIAQDLTPAEVEGASDIPTEDSVDDDSRTSDADIADVTNLPDVPSDVNADIQDVTNLPDVPSDVNADIVDVTNLPDVPSDVTADIEDDVGPDVDDVGPDVADVVTDVAGVPDVCLPDCEGRNCGSDGCGGSCGRCDAHPNSYCTPSGQCACVADDCAGLGYACGDWTDGCGGGMSCGNCDEHVNAYCDGLGQCACARDTCAGIDLECGEWSDGCGGTLSCGSCEGEDECEAGACVCTPQCTGECGRDACGGLCGDCAASEQCGFDTCLACWFRTAGGTWDDFGAAILPYGDGYVVVGEHGTFEGAEDPTFQGDLWFVRYDGDGTLVIDEKIGAEGRDGARDLALVDGRIAVCGYTIPDEAATVDAWLLVLNEDGQMLYEHVVDTGANEQCNALAPLADGGYVLAGASGRSSPGMWVVRLDSLGEVVWHETFPDAGEGYARDVIVLADGDIVVAGSASAGLVGYAGWMARLSGDGEIRWMQPYGATYTSILSKVAADGADGIVASGSIVAEENANVEGWMLRIDGDGVTTWEQTFTNGVHAQLETLSQGPGGGWIAAGFTTAVEGGPSDGWVVGTDALGNELWQRTYGGPGEDLLTASVLDEAGWLALSGRTDSGGEGGLDLWVLRVDAQGRCCQPDAFTACYTGHIRSFDACDTPQQIVEFCASGRCDARGCCESHVGTACFEGDSYWIDSCGNREALHQDCGVDGFCVEGACALCTPHDHQVCEDGALYWADDCGRREEHVRDCAAGEVCGPDGQCCSPACDDAQCGDDGCGGRCGSCAGHESCVDGGCRVCWSSKLGRGYADGLLAVAEASDGSYFVAGVRDGYRVGSLNQWSRGWVARLSAGGELDWEATFGFANSGSVYLATDVVPSEDGGCLVVGARYANDLSYAHAWAAELDATGSISWQQTYDVLSMTGFAAATPAHDGGWIAVGHGQEGGGSLDLWAVRITTDGTLDWQTSSGSTGEGLGVVGFDGGYLVAGRTHLSGPNGTDGWLVALSTDGAVVWEESYGGSANDVALAVAPHPEGGFVAVGETRSSGAGGLDGWLFRVDELGQLQWELTFGTPDEDSLADIVALPTGGFALTGTFGASGSLPFEFLQTWVHAARLAFWTSGDFWALGVDDAGALLWERQYGGGQADFGHSVALLEDGSTLHAGITPGGGQDDRFDGWLLRLGADGLCCEPNAYRACHAGDLHWFDACDTPQHTAETCETGRCEEGACCASEAALRCVGDALYWHDACGHPERFVHHCAGDEVCRDGRCEICEPRAYRSCLHGDVFWYDSCDRLEELAEECLDTEVCTPFGACCAPDCGGAACGPDGCGGGCGECPAGQSCEEGRCVDCWTIWPDDVYEVRDVAPHHEGGWFVVGTTASDLVDPFAPGGWNDPDAWVARLDEFGLVLWQRRIGGNGLESLEAVSALPDGGALVGGGRSVQSGWSYVMDAWVLRLSSDGTTIWEEVYDNGKNEMVVSIEATEDGTALVGALQVPSFSFPDGDKALAAETMTAPDSWLLHLDDAGAVSWSVDLSGAPAETVTSILAVGQEYVVVGGRQGAEGDGLDAWFWRVDRTGTTVANVSIPRAADQAWFDVVAQPDGTLVAAGYDAGGGDDDAWLVEVGAAGEILDELHIGGDGDERAYGVIALADGSLLLAGRLTETGMDESAAWRARVEPHGELAWESSEQPSEDSAFLALAEGDGSRVLLGGSVNGRAVIFQGDGSGQCCLGSVATTCVMNAVVSVDSCGREGDTVEFCAIGQACLDGACVDCTSHARQGCDEGHVWWFDACGVREERSQECPAGHECMDAVCVECPAGAYRTCVDNALSWYDACGRPDGPTTACAPSVCGPDGSCCTPSCGDDVCGPDGCGGLCGECGDGEHCQDGTCVPCWLISAGRGAWSSARAVVATPGGGSALAGFVNGSYYEGLETPVNADAWLVEVSPSGRIEREVIIDDDVSSGLYDLAYAGDGQFVLVGVSGATEGPWILQLGSDGDTVWETLPVRNWPSKARAVTAAFDGGWLVAGTDERAVSYERFDDPWLMKLNADGQVLWTQSYEAEVHEAVHDIVAASGASGGYLLVGWTYAGVDVGRQWWLRRVDVGGAEVWTVTLGADGHDEAHGAAALPNERWLVVGHQAPEGETGPKGVAVVLEANGDVAWSRTYGPDGVPGVLLSATLADDGDLLLAGTQRGPTGWLLRTDPLGAPHWQRTYANPGGAENWAITRVEGGDIVLAGGVRDPWQGAADAFVRRVDAEGRCCGDSDDLVCVDGDVFRADGCGNPVHREEDCPNSHCENGACCTPASGRECDGLSVWQIDSCGLREAIVDRCGLGQECIDGACVTCTSHDHRGCDGYAVYWYDACGQREDVAQICSDGTICREGQCRTIPDCWLHCGPDRAHLTCGAGGMSCRLTYDGLGEVATRQCSYENGTGFHCRYSYDISGRQSGICRSSQADDCSFGP